jgi:phosphatidate cytidylyltransferase
VIVVFPQQNHILLSLVIIAFTVMGAIEFKNILATKNLVISVPEAVILGIIGPVTWTLVASFGITSQIIPGAYILGASWLLVSGIFVGKEKFDSYINRITAGFAVMIYPGFFMSWIIRMALFHQASMVILTFMLIVILNDAMAWAIGSLFGKHNRGIMTASPSKSIVGFSGGFAASILTGIAVTVLIPDTFSSTLMASIPAGVILGLGTGAAAILGDLGESALKRSAGIKDSGSSIIGRGGALDSIDSLAMAAPVYYILYQVLF